MAERYQSKSSVCSVYHLQQASFIHEFEVVIIVHSDHDCHDSISRASCLPNIKKPKHPLQGSRFIQPQTRLRTDGSPSYPRNCTDCITRRIGREVRLCPKYLYRSGLARAIRRFP